MIFGVLDQMCVQFYEVLHSFERMFLRDLLNIKMFCRFFFSSRRRHTRCGRDWSSDVCSSDLIYQAVIGILREGCADPQGGLVYVHEVIRTRHKGEGKEGLLEEPVATGFLVLGRDRKSVV